MLFTPSCNTTLHNPQQNKKSLICSTPDGISISRSALQPSKPRTTRRLSGSLISFSDLHWRKAAMSITSSPSGNDTLQSEVYPSNVSLLMRLCYPIVQLYLLELFLKAKRVWLYSSLSFPLRILESRSMGARRWMSWGIITSLIHSPSSHLFMAFIILSFVFILVYQKSESEVW